MSWNKVPKFSLQIGEIGSWWAKGENTWTLPKFPSTPPPNQTPLSPIFSHLFSILLISPPIKQSLKGVEGILWPKFTANCCLTKFWNCMLVLVQISCLNHMWSFSGCDMNTLLIMYAFAYCLLGNWIGAQYNTLSLYLETMSLFSLKLYSRPWLSVWNDLPYSVHVCY